MVAAGPFISILQAVEELWRSSRADEVIFDIGLCSDNVYLLADLLAEEDIPFLFATVRS